MTNTKYQIPNAKLIVPLLTILLLAVGCQYVEKPVRGAEAEAEEGKLVIVVDMEAEFAPDSHTKNVNFEGKSLKSDMYTSSSLEGLEYWQAYHPVLVTGTEDPALKADPDELCLDCHYDPENACNVCHSYVGVKQVTSTEEF